MKKITDKLIKLMKVKDLSQADLARIAEVSEASVCAWIKGSRPRSRYLLRISKYFNIDPATLEDDFRELTFEEVPPPEIKDVNSIGSIFDEDFEVNDKEILEFYSDLLDELREHEKIEESPELATQDVLQSLFFTIIRSTMIITNTTQKLYRALSKKNPEIIEKISSLSATIQSAALILGQCARGTKPDKLKSVISNLQKHSKLQ